MMFKKVNLILLLISFCINVSAKDIPSYYFGNAVLITRIDSEINQKEYKQDFLKMANKIVDLILKIDQSFFKSNTTTDTCKCLKPSERDYKYMCDAIASKAKVTGKNSYYVEYSYEERLLALAGVDVENDNDEQKIKKLKCFWNKYKTRFACDTVSFNVTNGNLLKFAVSQAFVGVLEQLVGAYELDICFTDPADGLSLCQYLKSEYLNAIATQGKSHPVVAAYKEKIETIDGLHDKEKGLGCPCKLPLN